MTATSTATSMRAIARLSAIALVGTLASPALAFPFYPGGIREGTLEDYEACAEQLLELDVDDSLVSLACGTSYKPRDLSECVADIDLETEISALTALDACREVRRPTELASCTIDIAAKTTTADLPVVLDRCRRSLLPERYANCVVGITNASDLPPLAVMDDCIDADDRVRDFYPTFIPNDDRL